MEKSRVEAFSDGVLAIILTIMVLELKVPHGDNLTSLLPLLPVFLSYIISFIYIGIYWNNHHHLFRMVQHVNGKVLWANNHLLFWLSLVPFATAWMGENHFATLPVAVYGIILMMAGVAYFILVRVLISQDAHNHKLSKAVGKDKKGKISVMIYFSAIFLCFVHPYIGCFLYILVAMIWLIPDKRIENEILKSEAQN
jgi:uncharacterized membrane protein